MSTRANQNTTIVRKISPSRSNGSTLALRLNFRCSLTR